MNGSDLLALATHEHDGYFSSSSPTPPPPMVGCGAPHCERCVQLDYVHHSNKRYICTAPSSLECEHKRFGIRFSGKNTMLVKNHKSGSSKVPTRVLMGGNRRSRSTERVRAWVLAWLEQHQHLPGALGFLRDVDETITHAEYADLCDAIWQDYLTSNVCSCNIRSGQSYMRAT